MELCNTLRFGGEPWIHYPEDLDIRGLILVISTSALIGDSIKEYLIDLNFAVAGAFNKVNDVITVLDTKEIDAIVFDSNTTIEEVNTLEYLLNQVYPDLPLIIVSNSVNPIDYDNTHQVPSPLDPSILDQLLTTLIYNTKSISETNIKLIKFINAIFDKIFLMTPNEYQKALRTAMDEHLKLFHMRNSDIIKLSQELHSFIPLGKSEINTRNFGQLLRITFNDIADDMQRKEGLNWVNSLIMESIQAVISESELSDVIIQFLKALDVDVTKIQESLQYIGHDDRTIDREKNLVFLAYLGDSGPEIGLVHASHPQMEEYVTEEIGSQLITLVGQGSEYHEGIFGPIPYPASQDYVSIICSKLIKSSIKDERMKGNTIIIAVLVFARDLISHLPDRAKINNIFLPFIAMEDVDMIDLTVLEELNKQFYDSLIK